VVIVLVGINPELAALHYGNFDAKACKAFEMLAFVTNLLQYRMSY
jgi:hypothetical protein